MKFTYKKSIEILQRTPEVLKNMVFGLSQDWVSVNEGPNTWNVFDVIGHLIHGEKTDWIPRLEIILSKDIVKTFQPFDRFAQFNDNKGKSIQQLLNEFQSLRKYNLNILKNKNLSNLDYNKTGVHPAFGEVTLSQLLATWVVHDLNHISQISRIMANHYKEEVGPWIQYLGILKS